MKQMHNPFLPDLRAWLSQKTEDFTLEEARGEAIKQSLFFSLLSDTALRHHLLTLGCRKIEKRIEGKTRFWFRPPCVIAQPEPDPISLPEQHLAILGHEVRDRVSGLEGTITSVCFDLYGCVQALLDRGYDDKGEPLRSYWFDIRRLEITSEEPVMEQPGFSAGPQAEGRQGPADKPGPHR